MAVLNVYKRNERIIHKSNVCSKATLVVLLTFATASIVPLIVVYRSHGLWIKEAQYREQPDVHFKYQVMLITDTSAGPLVWSSILDFNSLMMKYIRTPVIKSSEIDENRDGLKDKLKLELELPLLVGELVYGATLLLIFDFRLQHVCEVTLEGAGLLQHNSGVPIAALNHYADLVLTQRHPLLYSRSNSQYNTSVFPTSALSSQEWSLSHILQKYWERNLTTRYANAYTNWQSGSANAFTINLEVKYPEQTILYKPGFWYVIKWAWVQYFCLLAVVSYFVNVIKDWIFQNSIVPTWVVPSRKKIL